MAAWHVKALGLKQRNVPELNVLQSMVVGDPILLGVLVLVIVFHILIFNYKFYIFSPMHSVPKQTL